ncbi:hypothetical protein HMPREF1211_02275 [Streptomyces sp. HGB0020]|nr:hypothetical protein HMPREF1211_02275 [Streptomyces sp. HGB0020]
MGLLVPVAHSPGAPSDALPSQADSATASRPPTHTAHTAHTDSGDRARTAGPPPLPTPHGRTGYGPPQDPWSTRHLLSHSPLPHAPYGTSTPLHAPHPRTPHRTSTPPHPPLLHAPTVLQRFSTRPAPTRADPAPHVRRHTSLPAPQPPLRTPPRSTPARPKHPNLKHPQPQAPQPPSALNPQAPPALKHPQPQTTPPTTRPTTPANAANSTNHPPIQTNCLIRHSVAKPLPFRRRPPTATA